MNYPHWYWYSPYHHPPTIDAYFGNWYIRLVNKSVKCENIVPNYYSSVTLSGHNVTFQHDDNKDSWHFNGYIYMTPRFRFLSNCLNVTIATIKNSVTTPYVNITYIYGKNDDVLRVRHTTDDLNQRCERLIHKEYAENYPFIN
jgi:hypothetical protein